MILKKKVKTFAKKFLISSDQQLYLFGEREKPLTQILFRLFLFQEFVFCFLPFFFLAEVPNHPRNMRFFVNFMQAFLLSFIRSTNWVLLFSCPKVRQFCFLVSPFKNSHQSGAVNCHDVYLAAFSGYFSSEISVSCRKSILQN